MLILNGLTQATTKRNVEDEVAKLSSEWRSPRWAETARPYTAKDVVALRGSLDQTYPADAMSKKLYETLLVCKATGGHSRTYGALDPVQVTTMAPHLTSIYVSGICHRGRSRHHGDMPRAGCLRSRLRSHV